MPSSWTSRQRVETALTHQEPDRIPISLTTTEKPYVRLREFLGLPPHTNLSPDRFGEVQPGVDLLSTLGVDITFVKLGRPQHWTAPSPLPDGSELDEWGVGRKWVQLPGGSSLYEVSYSPLAGIDPIDIDLDSYPWPDPHDPGRIDDLETQARRVYEETELAIMGRFGGTIMEMAAFLRGFEQWMMDLLLYPDFARDLMNRIADIQIAMDEVGIRAAGRYLSIFKVSGEDLGMQDRPLFSEPTWQTLLRPILRRRWHAAREALDRNNATHVKLMLHSDGAIRQFIPDILEDGIDVLDPVQHCPGMELEVLKRDFGHQLTFHGAIDTQYALPYGSEEEVSAEVIRSIHALGPGGGVILAPVHNVQADVPPQNIVTMCRTIHMYGRYPLQKPDSDT